LSVSPVLPSDTDSKPVPVIPAGPTHSPDAGIDPVTGLHRKSYIAGVGSHEYVSINVPAVVALVLGVASCLALIWVWLILIPIAGVACGVAGMVQVRRSNGTQIGALAAKIGVGLAVLCALIVGGQRVMEARQLSLEGQKISALCQEWGRDIAANQFDKAYKLYSDRFTDSVPFAEFKAHMTYVQSDPYTGPVANADWNGLAQFDSDSNSGVMTATGMVLVSYTHGVSDRWSTFFRQVNGQWQIDSMPDVFTEQKAPR
jgi:hypothetical protein